MRSFLGNRDSIDGGDRRALEPYPIDRRATVLHPLDAIRVNDNGHRHLPRGHELCQERVSFAQLQILPGEFLHVREPFFLAHDFYEMIEPLVFFGFQSDLPLPLGMQQVFIT